jgi:hypothetical protein
MADVLLNRVAQWGGTLSSVASNSSQFNGYAAGKAMFSADMVTAADSMDCLDLMVAFGALRWQETSARLNTAILFWGAAVNPRTGRAIKVGAGEFAVADTVFGVRPVY